MRKPEDRRCNAWDNELFDVVRFRCALSESMLVFKVKAMFKAPKVDVTGPS
jgi:hypothetical protein